MSLLDDLNQISQRRDDGGFIHGGHIHFIQSRCADDGMEDFVLKHGIYAVLERTPAVFPLDLPEIVERDNEYEPPDEMKTAIVEINNGLIIPLTGYDIIKIIRAGREYMALVQDA